MSTKTIDQYDGYTLTLTTKKNGTTRWGLEMENYGAAIKLQLDRVYNDDFTETATVNVNWSALGAVTPAEAAEFGEDLIRASQTARYLNGVIAKTEAGE